MTSLPCVCQRSHGYSGGPIEMYCIRRNWEQAHEHARARAQASGFRQKVSRTPSLGWTVQTIKPLAFVASHALQQAEGRHQ